MAINGIAHIILSVRDMERARPFYVGFCEAMGLVCVRDQPDYLYFVGGRTALGIRPVSEEHRNVPFDQNRVGLHHVCFRARSREDVDALHEVVAGLGAEIVHPPEDGPWAPGYYSVLFEDPDGIRIEVNFVPGKGLLAER